MTWVSYYCEDCGGRLAEDDEGNPIEHECEEDE